MKRIILIWPLFFWYAAWSQIGGSHSYTFLELANSSRAAALGNNYLTVNDSDITLAYSNPAQISRAMSTMLSMNYLNYFAGIGVGYVSYAQAFKKAGTFVSTMQFIDYGDFDETDYTGQRTGSFRAAEYAFTIGWSKELGRQLALGVNLKNIWSVLDRYTSYGLAADVALRWNYPPQYFSAALIMANMGRQITSYTGGAGEPLPFNVKLALSKRFEHAPMRLYLMADNLQRWDLTYSDPTEEVKKDPFTGEELNQGPRWVFGDKLMRHVSGGIEFAPGKGNFSLRLGYNYRRRAEMKIASRKAMVGFSWGFGIKVYKLHISYARATYSLAGASNLISMTTRFTDFLK